jgi:hypothetical protein
MATTFPILAGGGRPSVQKFSSFYVHSSEPYTISYLVAAGGGGGAGRYGGSGGGGGFLTGSTILTPNTVYSVIIGAGGAGRIDYDIQNGVNGGGSSFGSITAFGGGGGGANDAEASGSNGGSGGGGAGYGGLELYGGSGISGQGYNGGNGGFDISIATYYGGGGGGAGGYGFSGDDPDFAGQGGQPASSAITGSPLDFCAGGSYSSIPNDGPANTGYGGSGGEAFASGGSGGSGVVILSVPAANYSGVVTGSPIVTTSGANRILKFISSGSSKA